MCIHASSATVMTGGIDPSFAAAEAAEGVLRGVLRSNAPPLHSGSTSNRGDTAPIDSAAPSDIRIAIDVAHESIRAGAALDRSRSCSRPRSGRCNCGVSLPARLHAISRMPNARRHALGRLRRRRFVVRRRQHVAGSRPAVPSIFRAVALRSARHLPMQNVAKIRPSRSSGVNSPVISPRHCCACRSSSAMSSPARCSVSCRAASSR